MAFSGNGPVEEWIKERRVETRMVICYRNDLDDTDGYVRARDGNFM